MSLSTIREINGNFKDKDIISLDQFSKNDLLLLFSHVPYTRQIAKNARESNVLKGAIVTLLFYEPSSRTHGSFSASVQQLGGHTVEILDPQHFSSVSKGESLNDTIRVFEAYCDLIVIRHPIKGSAQQAADIAESVPVINAGDGTGEHPTQALLDLYTIYEKFGKLNSLTGVMAGDLLNGRTVHSLLKGLSIFDKNTIYLLAPEKLQLTRADFLKFSKKIKLIPIFNEKDIPKNADFWYWTRVQKERFKDQKEYEENKNNFVVTQKLLDSKGNKNMILMHPLPRIGEIEEEVDKDKRAVYLKSQIRNGMYIRMALLSLVLGKIK